MKKFLHILMITLFATTALAQVSVVTGAGRNDSAMGKDKYIESKTDSDLVIIKSNADKWNNDIIKQNDKLNDIDVKLNETLQEVVNKNDVFKLTEDDPRVKEFSQKHVPTCFGEKPRLAFENEKWVCKPAIKCSDLDGTLNDWYGDAQTGKCVKPAATWSIGAWGSCSNYVQRRTVTCKSADGKKVYNDDACVGPKPTQSRDC